VGVVNGGRGQRRERVLVAQDSADAALEGEAGVKGVDRRAVGCGAQPRVDDVRFVVEEGVHPALGSVSALTLRTRQTEDLAGGKD
jgi:hypothetical protein